MELGVPDLAARIFSARSPADAVSISRGKAARGHASLAAPYMTRLYAGHKARPSRRVCVVWDVRHLAQMVVAHASAGGWLAGRGPQRAALRTTVFVEV